MRLLKITLIAVGILVVLKIAEFVLSRLFPLAILFHLNLMKSLQLLVLAWLFLSLLLALIIKGSPGRVQRISTLSVLFVTLIFELLFGYLMQHPDRIPSIFLSSFRNYYSINHRKVIQVESNCSEFDPHFFYRLRPNVQCNFSNIEFSTRIEANSIGLRDDEQSLTAPDVICLGDSFAMGWGVQQQETFPQRLERTTGMKVLNAGMSSFGTVRELRKFQTLDTANCKWIVLQYWFNDVEETKYFVDNRYSLKTSPEATYDSLVSRYEWNRAYYPGKTFLSVSNYLFKEAITGMMKKDSLIDAGTGKVTMNEAVRLFAETLSAFNIPLTNRKIIVLYANEMDHPDDRFTKLLQQLLEKTPYKEKFANKIFLLNTSNFLTRSDKYILDDHYKASGHSKIAAAVKKIIDQHPIAPTQP